MMSINNLKIKYVYVISSIIIFLITFVFAYQKIPNKDIFINAFIMFGVYIFFLSVYIIDRTDMLKLKIIKLSLTTFFSVLIISFFKCIKLYNTTWISLMKINLFTFFWLNIYVILFDLFDNKQYNFLIISNNNQNEIAKKIILQFRKKINKITIYKNLEKYEIDKIKNIDIYVINSDIDGFEKNRLIRDLFNTDKTVVLIPTLEDISFININSGKIDDLLCFKRNRLFLTKYQKFFKRLIDLIISIIALVILLPLFIFISLMIKLFDNGPIFYYQKRFTVNQKEFVLIKFRTMVVNAENLTGAVFATGNDERITKIGRFLRQTRLDELPQIINIIKGDMSIVGPRPERGVFINQFVREEPLYLERLKVKAGITGLSQISVNYHSLYKDKLRFDLLYIYNYSFYLDIKIIFNTVLVLFNPSSSSGVLESKKLEELLNKYKLDINFPSENEIIISR